MGAMHVCELGTEKPLGMSSDLRLLASPPISVGTGMASPLKVNGFGTELGDDGAVACNAQNNNGNMSHCECWCLCISGGIAGLCSHIPPSFRLLSVAYSYRAARFRSTVECSISPPMPWVQLGKSIQLPGSECITLTCTRPPMGRPCAVVLLVLLALPTAGPGAAVLGRLLRQENLQEKAGCLQVRDEQSQYQHGDLRVFKMGLPGPMAHTAQSKKPCYVGPAQDAHLRDPEMGLCMHQRQEWSRAPTSCPGTSSQ